MKATWPVGPLDRASQAGPLLAPDGPAGGSPGSAPFLSCRPGSFGSDANQAFEHLAAWGVTAVEMTLPSPEDAPRLRAQLDGHGLRLGSVQVATDLGDPALDKHFELAARRAREEFGARYIFTSAHAGKRGLAVAYEALHRVGEAVAPFGVTVLLETHPDLGTNGATAATTMRAVNHPNVRVNWDPANVYFYNEHCDGRREFDQALPYVEGVHLKDTGGGFRAWDFGAIGDGVVDFPYILDRLAERGFHGPCTLEIEGVKGEELSPGQYTARVKKSVDYLRGKGYFQRP